jgi:hypothetical protein
MSTSGILTGGGFVKIPLDLSEQNDPKVRLYCLKDLTQEKIKAAKAALLQEIEKQRTYQGDLKAFEEEIKQKPYLLKEGKNLQLIKGKATQVSEKNLVHHIKISQKSSYLFKKAVQVGRDFKITGEHATIVININMQQTITNPLNNSLSADKLPVSISASFSGIPFGKAEWAKCFGDIGIEPPLPSNIEEILQSYCPFWPDNKVKDTHLLMLIPETVNGKPLTLESLEELVKAPKQGNPTQYKYLNLGDGIDPPVSASHWVLITRNLIPNSRSKSYQEQQALVKSYAEKTKIPYQVPFVLDATICLLLEYVRSGKRLCSNNPLTYTRCHEKWNERRQLIVGDFGEEGLYVSCSHTDEDSDCYTGVSALRRL